MYGISEISDVMLLLILTYNVLIEGEDDAF